MSTHHHAFPHARPMSSHLTRRTHSSARRAGATLAVLATLAAVGCGESDAKEAPAPAAAAPRALALGAQDVAVAREAEIGAAVTLAGPLQPKEQVTLRAQVPGTVADLHVDRGTPVRRGQRLASIRAAGVVSHAAGARAGVAAAEANVAVARKQMEAARALNSAGAMSDVERQSAEAQYEAAIAQLAAARAQATSAGEAAGFTALTAPFDGVVSARARQEGEAVNPGDEILTVVDPRVLELSGQIGVADASRVRVGLPVTFALDAFPGETFEGKVARVDPVADAGTRQVGVYVELANARGRIIGGQYARGRIALGTTRGIVVPMTAVRGAAADGSGAYVFVVQGGKVVRRAVTLGARDEAAGTVAVTNGVQAGAQLIATPTTDVAEGVAVQVTAAAPAKE